MYKKDGLLLWKPDPVSKDQKILPAPPAANVPPSEKFAKRRELDLSREALKDQPPQEVARADLQGVVLRRRSRVRRRRGGQLFSLIHPTTTGKKHAVVTFSYILTW